MKSPEGLMSRLYRWRLSTMLLIVPILGLILWYNLPGWRARYRVWLANEAIRGQLDRRISLPYPDGARLDTIFAHIRDATKSAERPHGCPVYFEPQGLQDGNVTLGTVVKINARDKKLKDCLKAILVPLGLDYYLKDGLLIIDHKDSIDVDL